MRKPEAGCIPRSATKPPANIKNTQGLWHKVQARGLIHVQFWEKTSTETILLQKWWSSFAWLTANIFCISFVTTTSNSIGRKICSSLTANAVLISPIALACKVWVKPMKQMTWTQTGQGAKAYQEHTTEDSSSLDFSPPAVSRNVECCSCVACWNWAETQLFLLWDCGELPTMSTIVSGITQLHWVGSWTTGGNYDCPIVAMSAGGLRSGKIYHTVPAHCENYQRTKVWCLTFEMTLDVWYWNVAVETPNNGNISTASCMQLDLSIPHGPKFSSFCRLIFVCESNRLENMTNGCPDGGWHPPPARLAQTPQPRPNRFAPSPCPFTPCPTPPPPGPHPWARKLWPPNMTLLT